MIAVHTHANTHTHTHMRNHYPLVLIHTDSWVGNWQPCRDCHLGKEDTNDKIWQHFNAQLESKLRQTQPRGNRTNMYSSVSHLPRFLTCHQVYVLINRQSRDGMHLRKKVRKNMQRTSDVPRKEDFNAILWVTQHANLVGGRILAGKERKGREEGWWQRKPLSENQKEKRAQESENNFSSSCVKKLRLSEWKDGFSVTVCRQFWQETQEESRRDKTRRQEA